MNAVERAFREEGPAVLATLIRQVGDIGLAEDALQDAFAAAVATWPRDGETSLTDGPFAEAKEYLAGYYVIEAPDLDGALAWAAKVPNAKYGTVEVRPVMDVGAPTTA